MATVETHRTNDGCVYVVPSLQWQARQRAPEASVHQQWGAVMVVASLADSTRILHSRDFALAVLRAQQARVPLVPVLLSSTISTSNSSEQMFEQEVCAVETLARACQVAPSAVHVVRVDPELLHSTAGRWSAPAIEPLSMRQARVSAGAQPQGIRNLRQALQEALEAGAEPGGSTSTNQVAAINQANVEKHAGGSGDTVGLVRPSAGSVPVAAAGRGKSGALSSRLAGIIPAPRAKL